MANANRPVAQPWNDYPTADGKSSDSDWHRQLMADLIDVLKRRYADEPLVHVSGDLLLYYQEGNKRRRVAPDVFVVRGVPRYERRNYLLWEEGRPPQVVIELVSSRKRREDARKLALYRDVLKVGEVFLFDVLRDYLDPPLQGHRLWRGAYRRIEPVNGRLPSRELGLHLEPAGHVLRLWSPEATGWLPTRLEQAQRAQARADQVTQELARLRVEHERLRNEWRRLGNGAP